MTIPERPTRLMARRELEKQLLPGELSAGVDVGYLARLLVQVTMPHREPPGTEFERVNGHLRMRMQAWSKTGLPFGVYPRLLLAWVTTEAVRTHSPRIDLGNSMSEFLRRLDLGRNGGARGAITGLRKQMRRLFECRIGWEYDGPEGWEIGSIHPVERASLWWDQQRPDQVTLWQSEIVLNDTFFRSLVERPVPVDMQVLKLLAKERSPLAIDIYSWLTHRVSYLERDQVITWSQLQAQFGGDYARTRDFKTAFSARLKSVLKLYPEAKVSPDPEGLILSPSPTSIPRRRL